MSNFFLYKILSNVKKRDNIAIYGISKEALEIKKYIEKKRKDIKILYFVEYKPGKIQYQDGIKIIDFKELFKIKNQIDNIIITKRDNLDAMARLFRQADLNYVEISEKDVQKLAYKDFEEVKKMFDNTEDKQLFTVIYVSSLTGDKNIFLEYIKQNGISDKQEEYLEFLKKSNIKTIIDTGENNGYNSMVFQNELKTAENIYCFDSLHDYVYNGRFLPLKDKELTYYKIIRYSDKIKLIGKILWNNEDVQKFSDKKLQTITLDYFREKNNLKIDFIKYAIDALEINVLKGSEETLKKDRPQLAIRIFQMPSRDYIEIMMFLRKILKKYTYKIGIYSDKTLESVLYCIPDEIYN